MKVLLTGATGFVGSHILDELCAKGISTAVLLRRSSNLRFIENHLPQMEVHFGSVTEPESLRPALANVSHVIHCAGCTKAVRREEFFEVNGTGTRNLVEAVNQHRGSVQRLVHISSLAVSGPATAGHPALECDLPNPVSEYGRSKLAAENEVRENCRAEFVMLRPGGVYGPRDTDFFKMFKAVTARVLPEFGGGRQAFSLAFVKDLAQAAVKCLTHASAAGKTFNVAASEIVTARALMSEISRQMKIRIIRIPLPLAALWPICLAQEILSRVTGKPSILSLEKYGELRAPGWVCDALRIRKEIGFANDTLLRDGIAETLHWYRQQGWLS